MLNFHEGTIFDSPRGIANAFAVQFSSTSCSEYYHPTFLTAKEAPIHFAMGCDFDYNQDLTTDELVRTLKTWRTFPGPDEIRYEMIKILIMMSLISC